MNKSLICGLLLLCAWPVRASLPWATPVQDLRGAEASLEAYRGRVVWLDFWASWCKPCRASFPWLNRMQERYGQAGFKVVAVNVDQERAAAERFLNRYPANFDVLHDPEGKLAEAMKVRGMPMGYLVNEQGQIVLSHVGFRESDSDKLEQEIRQLLKSE